jgi:hypothetical protein
LAATSEAMPLKVQTVRKLPPYAIRSTAYPARSFDEAWFEVRMKPVRDESLQLISNGQTVIIYHE